MNMTKSTHSLIFRMKIILFFNIQIPENFLLHYTILRTLSWTYLLAKWSFGAQCASLTFMKLKCDAIKKKFECALVSNFRNISNYRNKAAGRTNNVAFFISENMMKFVSFRNRRKCRLWIADIALDLNLCLLE